MQPISFSTIRAPSSVSKSSIGIAPSSELLIFKGIDDDGSTAATNLNKALKLANETFRDKGGDYVNIFLESFKKVAPARKINNLFVKGNNKSGIQSSSTESELNAELRKETDGAIDRVYEVVEKRERRQSPFPCCQPQPSCGCCLALELRS